MAALAFAREREKGRERKIQERRNDDDSQMQRRERYLKQRKPWYFYICLRVCVREDFLCRKRSAVSFRGGKKASFWENKKRVLARGCVALAQRRETSEAWGRGEESFFASEQKELDTRTRKTKKSREGKKKERRDLKSPHKNKFLASTTMADVQHERGYQKQVGVNVG